MKTIDKAILEPLQHSSILGLGSDISSVRSIRNWNSHKYFVYTCIAYAIGYGNFIRFPHQVHCNDGGSYLLAYTVLMVILGLPVLLLEFCMGQFSNEHCVSVFKLAPIFVGEGWIMLTITVLVLITYCPISAWNYFYLMSSMSANFPWVRCNHHYSRSGCTTLQDVWRGGSLQNKTLAGSDFWEYGVVGIGNPQTRALRPISDWPGWPGLSVLFCLFFTWLSLAVLFMFDKKINSKVLFFSIFMPYIMLFTFLIIGMSKAGSRAGLAFYFHVEFSTLIQPHLLFQAMQQVIYSLGIGMGTYITASGFNEFNDNFVRDALFILSIDYFTSFFVGLATFANVGYFALLWNRPIKSIFRGKFDLFFVAMPSVASNLHASSLWIFFYFMIAIAIGFDTQLVMLDNIMILVDRIDHRFSKNFRTRCVYTLSVCGMFFCVSAVLMCPGGLYYLELLDEVCVSITLSVSVLIECVVVGLAYIIRTGWEIAKGEDSISNDSIDSMAVGWVGKGSMLHICGLVPLFVGGLLAVRIYMGPNWRQPVLLHQNKSLDTSGSGTIQQLSVAYYISLSIAAAVIIIPLLIGATWTIRNLVLLQSRFSIPSLIRNSFVPAHNWAPANTIEWVLSPNYVNLLYQEHKNSDFLSISRDSDSIKGLTLMKRICFCFNKSRLNSTTQTSNPPISNRRNPLFNELNSPEFLALYHFALLERNSLLEGRSLNSATRLQSYLRESDDVSTTKDMSYSAFTD